MIRGALVDLLARVGLELEPDAAAVTLIALAAVLAVALLADLLVKMVLVRGMKALSGRTDARWDDALVEHKVFARVAHLVPPMLLHVAAREVFPDLEDGGAAPGALLVQRLIGVWLVVVVVRIVAALLDAGVAIIQLKPANRDKPLGAWAQLGKILFGVGAAIVAIGLLIDRSPWGLLTGLGALTAVLLLVFRDTLLGLVASMQISSYDLVRRGDWLEMRQFGADGEVLEVSLHTVRVQNWDKTFVAIPTHAFLEHSFTNWRGMEESGGRRIKRALHIDQTSVRFLGEEDLERLDKVQALRPYLKEKREDLARWNEEHGVEGESVVNGRRLTNLGTFRAYVERYLRNHPDLNGEMTLMVRQLPPGPTGIPVEIYAFSANKNWVDYEGIQADIFDHVLAVVAEFDLRVFQEPTGADLRMLAADQ